jgi:hypothetical protein
VGISFRLEGSRVATPTLAGIHFNRFPDGVGFKDKGANECRFCQAGVQIKMSHGAFDSFEK